MHQEKIINTLRDEAKRQLVLLKKLLEKTRDSDVLSLPSAEGSRATLDTESLPKILEILDGEMSKLEHLDMVLAVVGTMKAGKSTTINAIVGSEILPNRPRPMTALPTLIRHTKGVTKPRLIFEHVNPINLHIEDLHRAIYEEKSIDPLQLNKLESDPDMKDLLCSIKNKKPFTSVHEGEDAIFHFLKGLNDLVRLSAQVQVDFPFESYAVIDSMPVIEIEFSHLRNLDVAQGRLTLLDTPGPNEAGQSHLRVMLKDQLKKASAVLVVLDYAQFKSDADAEVRKNILEISKTVKDRIFILVNKFDECDRNGDSKEAVQKRVAEAFSEGGVGEKHIYPVSSKFGYLASRARNEIQRNGRLPMPEKEPWVEDFAKDALGRSTWRKQIENLETIREAADHLWQESGFAVPMEKVIVAAYKNAALEALRSAASKLAKHAEDASDFLKARSGALRKSAQEVSNHIDKLQKKVEKISEIERLVKESVESTLSDSKVGVASSAKKAEEKLTKNIDLYFKEGKKIEREQQKNKVTAKKKSNPIGTIFVGREKDSSQESGQVVDFDPKNPKIIFSNKESAHDLLEKIELSISKSFSDAEEDLMNSIQKEIEYLDKNFKGHQNDATRLFKSIKKDVGGFEIAIKLPSVNKISLGVSIPDLIRDGIEEKTKSVTRQRRSSSAWGTVCRWFNTDDWGWESYKASENYYEIDIDKIKESTEKGLAVIFNSALKSMEDEVYPKLHQSTDAFFSEFRKKVEHIRADLIEGLKDQSRSKEAQATLVDQFQYLIKEISGLLEDGKTLEAEAERLRKGEGFIAVAKAEVV